jgi:hypothetical protein
MPITTADPVMARLDRLERESRRWRRVALGSWLAIGALLLLGQSSPRATRPASPTRTVEAERFILRDARGRSGATLGWAPDDTPRLTLHDPAGQARTLLTVGAGGAPGLSLLDTDGKTVRAALIVGPDGAPGLALFDSAGKPRLAAALFHTSAGAARGSQTAPAIVAYDTAGVARVTFGLRGPDVAGLELTDGRGATRALLRVQADGAPDLALRDAQGHGRATLSVLADGTPAFNLHGADGRARATMTFVHDRGAALALADGRGTVVWSAPPP